MPTTSGRDLGRVAEEQRLAGLVESRIPEKRKGQGGEGEPLL